MDEKTCKVLATELAKGLKTAADLNQFSRMLTKLTVETALNAELTDHLGHEKNATKSGSNTRNGYSSNMLLSDDGEFEITTPRDHEVSFEPQLIKKNQKSQKCVELKRVCLHWDDKYPHISKSWRGHWKNLSTFFAYPPISARRFIPPTP